MRGHRAFNYFGSKINGADRYPRPIFNSIIEPFAGGAGYSLLYWDRDVTLYDVDSDVCKIWNYLIKTDPSEIEKLPLLEPGQLVSTLDIPEGAKLFIQRCCNQTCDPVNRLSSWAVIGLNKGQAGFWGPVRRARTMVTAERVKHWKVFNETYHKIDSNVKATWFIDPPYQGFKAYTFNHIDYVRLGKWCLDLPGQTIVCEQEGADWLPFKPLYQMRTQGRGIDGERSYSVEVMYHKDKTLDSLSSGKD